MSWRSIRYAVLLLLVPFILAGCPKVPPIANAGPDQVVNEGDKVSVQGAGDVLQGTIKSYAWTQTAGPTVGFQTTKNGKLTFVAPATEVQIKLTFQLIVTNNKGEPSAPDTVTVTVNQIKFFGTAVGSADDLTQFATFFNQVTPENAGKWGSVEATRDVMNWTELDAEYQYAKANKLPFKFHNLVWGQQKPGWIDSLTPEEQLAEIDEWMAAVAERYPDVDFIDVVNEPINTAISYKGALGGDGATGYDWVIKAFEMARGHFPHAKLLVNEFNTVILDQFTTNYVNLINLLKDRGLVDGIGEQGHFLEKASAADVKKNLDTLAATGLPIYISELDLNIANDALQANVMRDLFSVFWDHPAVAGITHWGYRQGATWETNSYLVRTDGTTRPAMDWIQCYIHGGGDTCTVPEYVPAGWKGNENGLTLEAEQFDVGQGVLALGSIIAYTDEGDYIGYKSVEFQQGWNTLWVNYAKGSPDAGSIAIYLDSMDGTPVATIDLPTTGSWGTSKQLENEWAPIAGTHDVYIVFHGQNGIANLDSVRIGKPIPQSGINLVDDGGFEAGTTGWNSWNGSSLSAVSTQAHSGSQSMLAANRPDAAGFAAYNLTSKVAGGTTYAVSAWAYLTGSTNDTVRLASKVACQGQTDTYPWIQNNTAVVPATWTQLSGNLIIPAGCTPTDVEIYFEGTTAGVDVYIDDVKVIPPDNNLVVDGGFEAGTAGWSSWNGATLAAVATQAHSGAQSMQATNRSNDAQFAVYSLTGKAKTETNYAVSAWVLINGSGNGTVRLASKLACEGASDAYPWLQNNTAVVPGTWTQLSGTLTIPADCNPTDVAIFFEGTNPAYDVYVDDVSAAAQ